MDPNDFPGPVGIWKRGDAVGWTPELATMRCLGSIVDIAILALLLRHR